MARAALVNRRALVVEDDDLLAGALVSFLAERASVVRRAATKGEAVHWLSTETFDIVFLDIGLPDGSGTDVLAAAKAQGIFPRFIAVTGTADPTAAFDLAEAGVQSFVAKPLSGESLERAWARALLAPDLGPQVRACVGRRTLRDLEDDVRRLMIDGALAASHGSRHKASQVLGISRQLLQQILRKRGCAAPSSRPNGPRNGEES